MGGYFARGCTKMSTAYSLSYLRVVGCALVAALTGVTTILARAEDLTPAQAAAMHQTSDLAPVNNEVNVRVVDGEVLTYAIPDAGNVAVNPVNIDVTSPTLPVRSSPSQTFSQTVRETVTPVAPASGLEPSAKHRANSQFTSPAAHTSTEIKAPSTAHLTKTAAPNQENAPVATTSTQQPVAHVTERSAEPRIPVAIPVESDPQTDELFLATYKAYQKRNSDDVSAGAAALKHHPLSAYSELWDMLLRLAKSPFDTSLHLSMDAFINRHRGEYIVERARTDWARIAADADDAERFHTLVKRLDWNQNESDIVCSKTRFALEAALKTNKGIPAALKEAHRVLQTVPRPGEPACGKLRSSYLAANPKATWSMFLILLQQKRYNPARELVARADAKQLPVGKKLLSNMLANPSKWYKQRAKRLANEPAALLLAASLRLASTDNTAAVAIANAVTKRLSSSRRTLLWSRLAYEAALNLDNSAPEYFAKAGKSLATAPDTVGHNNILAWNARSALRTGQWPKVLAAINKLPPSLKKSDAWVYWRARGLEKTGHVKEARRLFTSISNHTEFYGLLACEALGTPYPQSVRTAPVPDTQRWAKNDSVRRALSFYSIGLNTEGHREWNWALRGMKAEDRLNLSSFAADQSLHDREINTSESTPIFIFSQRYPRPKQTEIETAAKVAGLNPAWVYGLIRQESRFVRLARSSVGAQGMMQVMPRTARWVANHMELEGYTDDKLTDTAVNLTIGCQYLKLVADAFNGSMALATAAYNAGPSRSATWRAKLPQTVEGAIFVETIPFTETRNYVQRVLANTVHYATYYQFDKNVMKLSAILDEISPEPVQNVALP